MLKRKNDVEKIVRSGKKRCRRGRMQMVEVERMVEWEGGGVEGVDFEQMGWEKMRKMEIVWREI